MLPGSSRFLFCLKTTAKSPEAYMETSRQHPASDTAGHSVLETALQPHSTCVLTAFDKHSTCYLVCSQHFWEGIPWGLIWGLRSLRSLGRGLSVYLKSVFYREGQRPCDCSIWNFRNDQSRNTANPVRSLDPCGVEVLGSQGHWGQSLGLGDPNELGLATVLNRGTNEKMKQD